jgi:hypothetical protein
MLGVTLHRLSLIFTITVVGAVSADEPFVPNIEIQELINKWVTTADVHQVNEHYCLLANLNVVAARNYPNFAQQINYFVYHHLDVNALNAVHLYAFCSVGDKNIAEGLGPFLYSRDHKLRKLVQQQFPFTSCRANGPYNYPDYAHLREFVITKQPRDELSKPLKRMMFEYAPNAAFLLFHSEADGQDKLRWRRVERAIANARYQKQQLGGISGGKVDFEDLTVIRELADSDFWWARMFASEIMVQNKEFRDQDIIKRLREDENELVRNSIASLENPDPLRATPVDR